jgi:hypothetical protein
MQNKRFLFYRRSSLLAAGLAFLTLAFQTSAKGLTLSSEHDAARDKLIVEEVSFRHGNDALSRRT